MVYVKSMSSAGLRHWEVDKLAEWSQDKASRE
jgi:hypothetical protein